MGVERLKEIAAKHREMEEFARGDYIYADLNVEEEEYYVDLGAFGEQSMSVSLEISEYSLDAREILDKYPITTNEFDELADELDELAEKLDDVSGEIDLSTILTRMEVEGSAEDGRLARALRAVTVAFEENAPKSLVEAAAMSNGALPPSPLPWPGALRTDIDYTALDFPRRFQPPPGFNWVQKSSVYTPVPYEEAEQYETSFLRENVSGHMIMDNKGRISWMRRGDDDLSGTGRWAIWFLGRDGIPIGNGSYDGDTEPVGINSDGFRVAGSLNPWRSQAEAATAASRLKEIRESFEVETNSSTPSSYDPLTVELEYSETGTLTSDLRLGEDITGPEFGRVTSVRMTSEGKFEITMNRDGKINIDTRSSDTDWSVLRLASGRAGRPRALSLGGSVISYDPLTVGLGVSSDLVMSQDLRLGDDIVGSPFGRVIGIEDGQIVMNRDGVINRTAYDPIFKWSIRPIVVPNRESVPTARSLAPEPAAF